MPLYKFAITDENSPPPGKVFVRLDANVTDPDGGFGGNSIRAYVEMDTPADWSDVPAIRAAALLAIQGFCAENNLSFDPKQCVLTSMMV